jgi:hypothetical protein
MAWLNKIVDYTWPQIDTAVCATVRGAMVGRCRLALSNPS